VAPGLFHTVVCAEWLPNSPGAAALGVLSAKQTWGDFGHMTELAEACAAWKVRPVESSLRLPVQSSVKALLLSGDIDVRTPPEMGTHTAKTLPNATHVVIPHASHSTISVSCAAQILVDFFVADGKMSAVDTSCLKAIKQPAW